MPRASLGVAAGARSALVISTIVMLRFFARRQRASMSAYFTNKDYLTLKRASALRSSGEWSDDDYDVLAEGKVVGRIFKVHAVPVGTPWKWTLLYGYHEDRVPTHGYEPTRESAILAFAKSWLRE
jgi:hypothetical protein